jgi:hypothetical protein
MDLPGAESEGRAPLRAVPVVGLGDPRWAELALAVVAAADDERSGETEKPGLEGPPEAVGHLAAQPVLPLPDSFT